MKNEIHLYILTSSVLLEIHTHISKVTVDERKEKARGKKRFREFTDLLTTTSSIPCVAVSTWRPSPWTKGECVWRWAETQLESEETFWGKTVSVRVSRRLQGGDLWSKEHLWGLADWNTNVSDFPYPKLVQSWNDPARLYKLHFLCFASEGGNSFEFRSFVLVCVCGFKPRPLSRTYATLFDGVTVALQFGSDVAREELVRWNKMPTSPLFCRCKARGRGGLTA